MTDNAQTVCHDRPSDCHVVERVWRCQSERGGAFHSVATGHWEMVVARLAGKMYCTVRGPETCATIADCPADGEWVGISFKLGTFMPGLLPGNLRDGNDATLPHVSAHSFWLDDTAWEYPNFENADVFANRLVRAGLVVGDAAVDAALRGPAGGISKRTMQRRFLRATGMTKAAFQQIERARQATMMLAAGSSILETVHSLGYYDQPHLNRSLKRLIGLTPAEIAAGNVPLSFSYKTNQT